jgi:hypothetical protein
MRSDLLLQLADALEAPMPEGFHFDMRTWKLQQLDVLRRPCGFAVCAIGLAARLPGWQRLTIRNGTPEIAADDGKFHHSYFAVALLLEIEFNQSQYLFSPHRYGLESGEQISPLDVASRIRAFVESAHVAA